METPCSIERLPKITPTARRRPNSCGPASRESPLLVIVIGEVVLKQDRISRSRDRLKKAAGGRDTLDNLDRRLVQPGVEGSISNWSRVPGAHQHEDIAGRPGGP